MRKYDFLSADITARLALDDGYPLLGRGFETSIPGLHMLGAPAARSFGPTMRFVSGSWFAGSEVARALADPRSSRLVRPARRKPQRDHDRSTRSRPRMDRVVRAGMTVISDPVEGVERVREKVANEAERWSRHTVLAADDHWEASCTPCWMPPGHAPARRRLTVCGLRS